MFIFLILITVLGGAATVKAETNTIVDTNTVTVGMATIDLKVSYKYSDQKKYYVYDTSSYKTHFNRRYVSKVSVSRSTSSVGVRFTIHVYDKNSNRVSSMYSSSLDKNGNIEWFHYDLP